jgi:hypothetical protein
VRLRNVVAHLDSTNEMVRVLQAFSLHRKVLH